MAAVAVAVAVVFLRRNIFTAMARSIRTATAIAAGIRYLVHALSVLL
jgi:uncharacterized protein YhhL (DUF1145 family)